MRTWALAACLYLVGCRQIFGLDEPVRGGPGDGGVGELDAFVAIDAADAGTCVGPSLECAGTDTLRACDGPGTSPKDLQCAWGCDALGSKAHCFELQPQGGVATAVDLAPMVAIGAVSVPGDTTIDTDTGEITGVRTPGGGVVSGILFEARTAGGVFTAQSFTFNGKVIVHGSRPLVLVGITGITVTNLVDLRGPCTTNLAGPGGGAGGAAGGDSAAGSGGGGGGAASNDRGGGGGGYGGMGGPGGNSAAGGNPAGGAVFGTTQIMALVGGGGGGAGGDTTGMGVGGGGGGAVQLVSNGTVVVGASGGVNAGGCGGKSTPGNDSGGGGGAGGAILIEAVAVTINGVLAVNGGGGGGGEGGGPGQNGNPSRAAALGDTAGNQGDGGDGAAGAQINGKIGLDASNAGGGGGALGRIRIHTRSGTATIGGVMSPAFDDPGTTASQGAATVL